MSFSKTLIALVATLGAVAPAFAAPASVLLTKRGVAPNTQSCTVSDNVFFLSYSIDIGITYANGGGCDAVLGSIQGQGIAVTNWQCVDDGAGNTQLWFNTPNGTSAGDGINTALEGMYPTIEGGFNCPDE